VVLVCSVLEITDEGTTTSSVVSRLAARPRCLLIGTGLYVYRLYDPWLGVRDLEARRGEG
jgi:hypothetical protein